MAQEDQELIVLDAWPVLELLFDQPHAQKVDGLLHRVRLSGIDLPICAVNWGEALYRLMQTHGEGARDTALEKLTRLPIAPVAAGPYLASRAARLKAGSGLGYADCFAAALAITLDAPLATGDPDFRTLEPQGLRLHWLGD